MLRNRDKPFSETSDFSENVLKAVARLLFNEAFGEKVVDFF